MTDRRVAVTEFMTTFGQTVRTIPTTDITDTERVLRARLVYEEAVEFVEAMGCFIGYDNEVVDDVRPDHTEKELAKRNPDTRTQDQKIDLVAAADALADITVVTEGSAITLGVDLDRVFDIVHGTNMSKVMPDGTLNRDEFGKVLKPEGWVAPTEKIAEYIEESTREPETGLIDGREPRPLGWLFRSNA